MVNIEVWEDIPGYAGLYQVSDGGRVKSLARNQMRRCRRYPIKERLLKLSPNKKDGYVKVTLCKNKRHKDFRVHTLVLLCFVGECPEGTQGCHKDGIKLNNGLSNLKYGTAKDNALDRLYHGRTASGERNGNSVLKSDAVAFIRSHVDWPLKKLSEKFGVCINTIYKVQQHKIWKHI